MKHNSVCILGGTGFVGSQLACQLAASGRSVHILTRNRERNKHLLVVPNICLVETDIFDRSQLNHQFKDIDAVINLVGILNEKQHNGDGFRKAHIELPKHIVDACLANDVHRVLHMSALNANANTGRSHYLRSKGKGENALHAISTEKLQVTSFRPSVIFGPNDSFFNRFADLLKLIPLIFPLACPHARFAPVYVGDVANRFIQALDDKDSTSKRYDLCGPEEYSLIELVKYTVRQLGIKRAIIGLPDPISHLQAAVFEWFPGKPFSLDNYNSLQIDSTCKQGTREPTSIESIVPFYIGNKGMQKKYDTYRKRARR
jgi:NADH dehydrogenase